MFCSTWTAGHQIFPHYIPTYEVKVFFFVVVAYCYYWSSINNAFVSVVKLFHCTLINIGLVNMRKNMSQIVINVLRSVCFSYLSQRIRTPIFFKTLFLIHFYTKVCKINKLWWLIKSDFNPFTTITIFKDVSWIADIKIKSCNKTISISI